MFRGRSCALEMIIKRLFSFIAKPPEPSSKAGPFRSLNGHIHGSLARFKCLVGTRVIISLLFEICFVALSFCYMTCNDEPSPLLRPRNAKETRSVSVSAFIRPGQRCPSRRRTDRPRTFGYPCFAPGRSAEYRQHFGKRSRESYQRGRAHPSGWWKPQHQHRGA